MRAIAVAVALMLLSTACGSTAKKTRDRTSTDSSLTEPSSTAKAGSSGESPVSSSRSSGSISAPGGGGGSSGGTSVPGVTSKHVAAKAPGITSSTFYIGAWYSSQAADANRALGASGAAASYDARDVYNATIDYANKHGGFAGRKMKGLYYDIKVTADVNTEEQAACDFWTKDNKVFAITSRDEIMQACAEKAGGVAIGGGNAVASTYAKYPHLVDPAIIRFDRLGQVTVAGLAKAGYFGGKFGLVTWDSPTYKLTVSDGYIPALKKIHVAPVQIAYIQPPQNFQAISDTTAAISSAVAKFKGLGIDHVIIQDGPAGVFGGDGLTLEWMNHAKSQQYRPRYGQNFYNAPGWSVNPSDQQDHALAVNDADLDKANDEGWHLNAAREKCYKIQADAGYPVSSANLNDQLTAASSCDFVFFIQRLVNSLPEVTPDAFIASAQRLGTSFVSSQVYGSKLFSGRRDGSDMVRVAEYFDSCKCLKYKGAPYYVD